MVETKAKRHIEEIKAQKARTLFFARATLGFFAFLELLPRGEALFFAEDFLTGLFFAGTFFTADFLLSGEEEVAIDKKIYQKSSKSSIKDNFKSKMKEKSKSPGIEITENRIIKIKSPGIKITENKKIEN